MPDCRIGAVIMKITSSTSITSTKGTMLISEREVAVPRCICGIVHLPRAARFAEKSGARRVRTSGVQFLDSSGYFQRKIIHSRGHVPNVVQKMVVADHRRHRRE